jgi:small subunit ribosomal protein S17
VADEEKNETTEEQAPEAEAPVEEAPEQEAAPEEAPAEEAPAEDAPADDAPAEEAPADDASGDEAPAGDGAVSGSGEDDEFEGDWKARRRMERSRESGEAGPQRGPDERAAERDERRSGAAKVRASYRRKRRESHQAGEGTPSAEHASAGRKERQGTVVSSKADKTITVRIDVARRHPAYEKIVRQSSTLHAHDESNEAGEGDLVRIVETRPLSKTKRWRLVEVVEKAK